MAYAKKRQGHHAGVRYTAVYVDPCGRERSAGTFDSKRAAERAAHRAEGEVLDGEWIDPAGGKIRFREYVEVFWWPSRHLEVSTKAAYRSYLDRHFLPFFGSIAMASITPSTVQAWVTRATADGLSPRSVVKYHVLLHSIFKRAVRDRVLAFNPCSETELPKVVRRPLRIPSPIEFDRLLAEMPERYRLLLLVEIETGLRWGELIALRPRHIDFLRRLVRVEQVVVEVSKRHSPTGERMIVKDYPKNDQPRVLRVGEPLVELIAAEVTRLQLRTADFLFSATGRAGGGPLSRNTFRSKVWLPALDRAGLGFHVRVHDLRHAHASWLLAGGADLKTVMDRMGHAQIATTQRYLHALPDAQDHALAAFTRVRSGMHTAATTSMAQGP